jgi:hypothetical protein
MQDQPWMMMIIIVIKKFQTLRLKFRLRMFENWKQRKFGTKTEEVTGGWRLALQRDP